MWSIRAEPRRSPQPASSSRDPSEPALPSADAGGPSDALGSPGPDRGCALGLASRFADHLILADACRRDWRRPLGLG